jgi:gamma-glutamyltranspeptidase/glutathione hydrolase
MSMPEKSVTVTFGMGGNMKVKGAVAAGHPETARAAALILDEGGNAFDAVVAGLWTACVAEPIFASLGGGGFLLARPSRERPVVYDFFVHTPKVRKAAAESDFFPILADFGAAQQEFHIGMGSIATPGAVKGLFQAHGDLGTMPMARVMEPAMALAKSGLRLNPLQAYLFRVIGPILESSEASRAVFMSRENREELLGAGEMFSIPSFADTLDGLAREGEGLFYRGEIARTIVEDCRKGGGTLEAEDLEGYRVVRRQPLELELGDGSLFINPPPSTGGILIAFALEILKESNLGTARFGSAAHLQILAQAMALTNKARVESRLHELAEAAAETLLHPGFLETYRRRILGRPAGVRGTTHIGVIDADGNAASLSISNGEGSGYMVPGTGIMMNNMLGEEDIIPHGFHAWPTDTRIGSMMAPALMAAQGGAATVLGSGGSNRIRTALLQVMVNLRNFGMSVEDAVSSSRIHYEDGLLDVEAGFDGAEISVLAEAFPKMKIWDDKNLYFGGVHTVRSDSRTGPFDGAGDLRRGGVAITVRPGWPESL